VIFILDTPEAIGAIVLAVISMTAGLDTRQGNK